MSKPEFDNEVYNTDCGMWFSHEPGRLLLTDEAYKILEDSDWCGYMGFEKGVDYIEVEDRRPSSSSAEDYHDGMYIGKDDLGKRPWSEATCMVDGVWESTLIDMIMEHTKAEGVDFWENLVSHMNNVLDEVEQPKTVSNIDGNEDEACRCGSTTWLYDNEGDAVLCKECWDNG